MDIKHDIAARAFRDANSASHIRNRCHGALQHSPLLERIEAFHAIGISNTFANEIRCQAHRSKNSARLRFFKCNIGKKTKPRGFD